MIMNLEVSLEPSKERSWLQNDITYKMTLLALLTEIIPETGLFKDFSIRFQ